jgi:hypothetical protein
MNLRQIHKAEQAIARDRRALEFIHEEHDAIVAKTERLREQRLAKEAAERKTGTPK